MNRKFSVRHVLVPCVLALLIVFVMLVLSEYFGWHLVREAGGEVASAPVFQRRG
jgi:hypothetical protein